jgi:predicted permease
LSGAGDRERAAETVLRAQARRRGLFLDFPAVIRVDKAAGRPRIDADAFSLLALLIQLGTVFYRVVLPMLLVAAAGFVVQKRLRLDMGTLTDLNFTCVLPAMIFFSIVSARLQAGNALLITAFGLAFVAATGLVTFAATLVRGVPPDQRSAATLAGMMHNSGNFGMPLQRLAFAESGMANAAVSAQTFVLISQSLMSFTVGVALAAGGKTRVPLKDVLRQVLRLPPVYALAAGFLVVRLRDSMPADALASVAAVAAPFWDAIGFVKDAFVGLAMLLLGAQLATIETRRGDYPVAMIVILKLVAAPVVSYLLIRLFGIDGFLGRVLLIGTANPTAINTLLMCMKFDNHPGLLARAVLYTTVLAPLAVTPIITVAGILFP